MKSIGLFNMPLKNNKKLIIKERIKDLPSNTYIITRKQNVFTAHYLLGNEKCTISFYSPYLVNELVNIKNSDLYYLRAIDVSLTKNDDKSYTWVFSFNVEMRQIEKPSIIYYTKN